MEWTIRTLGVVAGTLFFASLMSGAASADVNNTNTNTQTATNSASSVQTVAAASGIATAEGEESIATSGAASAAAQLSQTQAVSMAAINDMFDFGALAGLEDIEDLVATVENSNSQTGGNGLTSEQSSAAVSADANATGEGSTATSGNAGSLAANVQSQLIELLSRNGIPTPPEPPAPPPAP